MTTTIQQTTQSAAGTPALDMVSTLDLQDESTSCLKHADTTCHALSLLELSIPRTAAVHDSNTSLIAELQEEGVSAIPALIAVAEQCNATYLASINAGTPEDYWIERNMALRAVISFGNAAAPFIIELAERPGAVNEEFRLAAAKGLSALPVTEALEPLQYLALDDSRYIAKEALQSLITLGRNARAQEIGCVLETLRTHPDLEHSHTAIALANAHYVSSIPAEQPLAHNRIEAIADFYGVSINRDERAAITHTLKGLQSYFEKINNKPLRFQATDAIKLLEQGY